MKNGKRNKNLISLENCVNTKRRKISHSLNEFKIENKIVNDSIEIIKLTVDDDSDDEDCEWEDVSELSEASDIVIKINERDADKNEKQKQKRIEREINTLIKRTMLMSLFGRVIYINQIISNHIIQNLSLSRFPKEFIELNCQRITLVQLRKIVCAIKSQFHITDDYCEEGNVLEIVRSALERGKVSMYWINVVLLAIVRSVGICSRLVGVLYLQKRGHVQELCPPTKYRASTRGYKTCPKTQPTKKKNFCLPSLQAPMSSSSLLLTAELLDQQKRRWIAVDITNTTIVDDVTAIVSDRARFVYTVAIDGEGYVRDVAPRYDDQWAESSRRSLCVSRDSWQRILDPFMAPTETDIDRLEAESIKSSLLSRGIPRTAADLKGHPLFVLKKHIKKYEVIYPIDTERFGLFNNEEVYLRDNVVMAHTRETWLKEAMVVKNGEIPCKRVKTMMSTIKQKSHGTDPLVDIFGPWQIERFIPPKAENGIVPVNSHGNVHLFQPSMLPEGCVHITMKGIDKVAKKLNINYASAMVGWGFVKGHRAVPVLDGWVVCKEHIRLLKDALIEWNRVEALKSAAERQRVVIKRWEILTRRILLKERLRVEYNF